jgi:glutathione S-transferase
MPLILHQFEVSPFCGKVRRMLRFKGLDFEVEEYAGLRALSASKLSPGGFLPVLEVDGTRVHDSSAIARLLDRRVPSPPLVPSAPAERARARLWEDWADEALHWFEVHFRIHEPEVVAKVAELLCAGRPAYEVALMRVAFPRTYRPRIRGQGLGRLPADEILARFEGHLDMLEDALSEGPYLVGEAPTVADFAVLAQLAEILRTSTYAPKVRERATLMAWVGRLAPYGS